MAIIENKNKNVGILLEYCSKIKNSAFVKKKKTTNGRFKENIVIHD